MTFKLLNAADVGCFIINYSLKNNYIINMLKLHQLMYFVQAFYLVYTEGNAPCFEGEILASSCGIIVPAIKEAFKFTPYFVHKTSSYYQKDNFWKNYTKVPYSEQSIPLSDQKMIKDVVDLFKDYDNCDLNKIILNQQPYKNAVLRDGYGAIIYEDDIRNYFFEKEKIIENERKIKMNSLQIINYIKDWYEKKDKNRLSYERLNRIIYIAEAAHLIKNQEFLMDDIIYKKGHLDLSRKENKEEVDNFPKMEKDQVLDDVLESTYSWTDEKFINKTNSFLLVDGNIIEKDKMKKYYKNGEGRWLWLDVWI